MTTAGATRERLEPPALAVAVFSELCARQSQFGLARACLRAQVGAAGLDPERVEFAATWHEGARVWVLIATVVELR